MSEAEINELREKILQGISVAFQRLVEQKERNGEELVFSQDGKIVRIKAAEIRKEPLPNGAALNGSK